jgi:hypothetical protein
MTKFINHVDHVAWISNIDTIDRNVEKLSRLFEVEFVGPRRSEELGFTMYLCWEAGLEMIAPHPQRTEFNRSMHEHLEARGEGPYAIIFGVRDLAKKRVWLDERGYAPSEAWGDDPSSPWSHKLKLKELDGGYHVNTRIIFSEIDYADGVVTTE